MLSFRVMLRCSLSKYGKETQLCISFWRCTLLNIVFCSGAHLQLAPGSVILVPRLSGGLTSSLSRDLPQICSSQLCDQKRADKGRASPEMLTAVCRWVYFYGTVWTGVSLSKMASKCSPWGLRLTAMFVLPPVLLCRSEVSVRLRFSTW